MSVSLWCNVCEKLGDHYAGNCPQSEIRGLAVAVIALKKIADGGILDCQDMHGIAASALEKLRGENTQAVADEIAAEFGLPKVQKDIPCPNCYGGHFRPCQWCGDTGRVDFVPNDPSSATRPAASNP